eukprot:TRINITY_DN5993_c0_g1_i1.p1 TRINITY_DN5993_c0_g1~~TRINITY_DN5993_c0_g1_i1.p1  ORF type:complete len:323 (-),score=21.90 TRINITY_DN5993_c0_g1_i1:273-1190(-)
MGNPFTILSSQTLILFLSQSNTNNYLQQLFLFVGLMDLSNKFSVLATEAGKDSENLTELPLMGCQVQLVQDKMTSTKTRKSSTTNLHNSSNQKDVRNGSNKSEIKIELNIIDGWSNLEQGYQPKQIVGANPLVWIDLEMTGLDLEKDTVLEIACLITDGQLNKVIQGPNIVVYHEDEVIKSMNEWCVQHHYASGLVQRVKQSKTSMEEAEKQVLQFLKSYIGPQQAQLAGNSVHVDKTFLTKCMPQIVDYLNYRIVDVSTLKELCRRWYPQVYAEMPKKRSQHLAMDDIIQSVKELAYYRQVMFK